MSGRSSKYFRKDAIAALPQEAQADFTNVLTRVEGTLATAVETRDRVFDYSAQLDAMTADLQSLAASLQAILLQTADDAYLNISLTGEDTQGFDLDQRASA